MHIKNVLTNWLLQSIIQLIQGEMQQNFGVQKQTFLYPQILTLEAQKQKLKCPNKIPAFSVCIDPKCLVAGLMCRDSSCQCTKTHYKCHHIQIDRVLDSIDKHQKQIPQEVRESYKITHQIINGMLDELSKIRSKLNSEQRYFGLTEKELSFMALIDEQKIDKICGKIVSELEKTFEAEISFMILSHEEILKDFKSKRPQFDSLCKYIENTYTKFGSNQNNKILFNDSKIIKYSNQKQMMQNWLEQTSNKKQLSSKLLFRASEHNFSTAEFHKRCDGVENTLVVVKTEFDKIIGGFTANKWQSQGGYVNDGTGKAFLFSLTLNEKYKCTNPENSIYCHKSTIRFGAGNEFCAGNEFSAGNDIRLTDNAHNSGNSYAGFPHSYNLVVNGTNKYQNNQQTYTLFSGATNGKKFNVKQYEVYEIQGIKS